LSLVVKVEKRLSQGSMQAVGKALTLAFFIAIVLSPILYVFFQVFSNWSEVYRWVFADPFYSKIGLGALRFGMIREALVRSFEIAGLVTLIDVIVGLPMALIMARYEFRGKGFVDTLIDLPLAVPTAALGFSLYLFWGTADGIGGLLGIGRGLFSRGPILVILTHVAFTYPYIVRSLKAVIESIDRSYEYVARTLGAPGFTVFRTVTAPLMKEGLVAGAILSFTRSLGETGATLIVCGAFETAPVLIVSWRRMLLIPPTAFLSMVLIATACALLVALKFFARRVGFPIKKVWPGFERKLSGGAQRTLRDVATYMFFIVVVLIPSCFTFLYMSRWWAGSPYTGAHELGVFYQMFLAGDRKYLTLVWSLLTSLAVASISTLVNLLAGIPMAYYLARGGWKRLKDVVDSLVDFPLMIPSSALGFAAFLFWGPRGLGIAGPGFWLITLTHIAFTYPYIVRPLVAVFESVDPGLEEAARTMGAPPLTVFRTVTLQVVKPGILATSIMAFTRSLSETGATLVVMGFARTVPVLIVQWVESLALQAASFACVVLIVISYLLLFMARRLMGGE